MEAGVSVTLGPLTNTQAVNHKPISPVEALGWAGQDGHSACKPSISATPEELSRGQEQWLGLGQPSGALSQAHAPEIGPLFPKGKETLREAGEMKRKFTGLSGESTL